MDGLKIIRRMVAAAALAAFVASGVPASADQTNAVTSVPAICAVIGDVAAPNTYHFPGDQPLTMRDAVDAAGMISETATVMLLRPSAPQPWTEFIARSSAQRGTSLLPGDVLVVTAEGRTESVPQATAAIVIDGRPTVLALRGNSETPVVVQDVLVRCGMPEDRLPSLQLISARAGRSGMRPALNAVVEHGDILLATPSISAAAGTAPRFSPMVSEWHETASDGGRGIGAESSHSGLTLSVPTVQKQSPESGHDSAAPALTIPEVTHNLSEQHSGVSSPEIGEASTRSTLGQMVSHSESEESGQGSRESAELTDAVESFATAWGDQDVSTRPAEEVIAPVGSSTFAFWNSLFIVGLLIAGCLIIVGWLKSEAELRAARIERPKRTSHSTHEPRSTASEEAHDADHIRLKYADRQQADSLLGSEVLIHNSLPDSSMQPEQTAALSALERSGRNVAGELSGIHAVSSSSELVSPSEWLEGSWLKPLNERVMAEQAFAASTHAVPTEPVQTHTTSAHTTSAHTTQEHATPAHAGRSESKVVTNVEGFAAEALTRVDMEELNDLIANRLPVDLCTAQLPLRVSLFGRPAGPRRLRIDAAHTQLAGPHMAVAAERRRADLSAVLNEAAASAQRTRRVDSVSPDFVILDGPASAAASAAPPGGATTDGPATITDGPATIRPTAGMKGGSAGGDGFATGATSGEQTVARSGGLDRALNFLHEKHEQGET